MLEETGRGTRLGGFGQGRRRAPTPAGLGAAAEHVGRGSTRKMGSPSAAWPSSGSGAPSEASAGQGRCCVACGVGGTARPGPGDRLWRTGTGLADPGPAAGHGDGEGGPACRPRRVQARRPGPVGRLHRPAPASARLRRPCLADGCGRAFARHARPGRTAPGRRRPARSLPACKDRLAGPERQDAAPPRAGLAGWPVRHPTAPPRNAATAGGVPGRQPGDTAGPPAPDRPAVRVHQCRVPVDGLFPTGAASRGDSVAQETAGTDGPVPAGVSGPAAAGRRCLAAATRSCGAGSAARPWLVSGRPGPGA